jgi:hypothetical protein
MFAMKRSGEVKDATHTGMELPSQIANGYPFTIWPIWFQSGYFS